MPIAFAVTYGVGSAAFAGMLLLVLLGRRPAGPGWRIVLVCAVTLLWTLAAAVGSTRFAGATAVLESARSAAWLWFMSSWLAASPQGEGKASRNYLPILALAVGAAAVGNDLRFVAAAVDPVHPDFTQILVRVAVAVTGLLVVENLYRNTSEARRWHVVPICIGIGGMFAYDLFLYSDALLFRRVDLSLLAARGAMMALIVPMLALTLARNRDWRIDIHISRQAVFHTATLLASGAFLIAAAAAALVLKRIPGDWGALLQAVFLFGSLLVLATVLSSGTLRSRARGMVARNLFSHRYDYRVEWMKFIDTVSRSDGTESLQMRVIHAIADITDSPGGVLWLRADAGRFRPAHAWNMRFDPADSEPEDGAFVAGFVSGTVVQELSAPDGSALADSSRPKWASEKQAVWLAVPLCHGERMLGFVALAPARAPAALDWESRDLLIAVGKQAASYVSEEQAARTLADAQLLTEYSQRFAFVVHDIKNLVSQLTMTVRNAQAHGEDPEFRRDMLGTLENSVSRMKELLAKLRAGDAPAEANELSDPGEVILSAVEEIGRQRVKLAIERGGFAGRVAIKSNALKSALTHLISNALEASPQDKPVVVRLRTNDRQAVIEVRDEGEGMDENFVRDELFRPFRSTKSGGHGIGAFQARETIRGAGGDLQVISRPGAGTTMRIVLPCDTVQEPVRAVGS